MADEFEVDSDSDYGSEIEEPKSRRKNYNHWGDYFLAMDMFSANPGLEMRGKTKVRSCWGAFVSLFVILILLVFIAYRISFYKPFTMLQDIFGMIGLNISEELSMDMEFDVDE